MIWGRRRWNLGPNSSHQQEKYGRGGSTHQFYPPVSDSWDKPTRIARFFFLFTLAPPNTRARGRGAGEERPAAAVAGVSSLDQRPVRA